MPVMDGEEATRRIRRLPGGDKVKIVAVTASAFKEEQQTMLSAGMDDFVRKPYHVDELYDCLARQLAIVYRYSDENMAENESEIMLSDGMLTGLVADQKQELRDALVSLDSDRIATVIAAIGEGDARLSRALMRLAERFDYPAILRLLQEADEVRKP